MWISEKLIDAGKQTPAAEVAKVTGKTSAQGKAEYRSLRFAAPWGIAYMPPSAASAVLVESTDGITCVGTTVQEQGLKQGELLLYSAGGARIYLKNSGEVEINGKIFAAKGT